MNVERALETRLALGEHSIKRTAFQAIVWWVEELLANKDEEIQRLRAEIEGLKAGPCSLCGGYKPGHGMITNGADICNCRAA